MPSVIRTDAATVFLAVRARLASQLSLGTERILMSADEEVPDYDPHGDHYLILRDRGVRGELMGGGRLDSRVRHRAALTLRSRLALDEPATDTVLLTDATRGHFTLAHAMRDALEGRLLEQTSGNALLHECIHVQDATRAERMKQKAGWASADYSFDLCYTLDLTVAKVSDL